MGPVEEALVKTGVSSYSVIGGVLYKSGLSSPLPNFPEVHEGIIWKNLRIRALAKKVLRVGYY